MPGTDDLILLVEDDDIDAESFARHFNTHRPGMRVMRALDGVDAMKKLATEAEPDLIVMDIRMPFMDGKEALSRIKNDPAYKQIPVVMMSNSENSDDIEYCYEHHANAYVVKHHGDDMGQKMVENVIAFWFDTATLPRWLMLP